MTRPTTARTAGTARRLRGAPVWWMAGCLLTGALLGVALTSAHAESPSLVTAVSDKEHAAALAAARAEGAALGRAFAQQNNAAGRGQVISVSQSADVTTMHPAIIVLLLASAAAWLYLAAKKAQRGWAVCIASAFLGVVLFAVLAQSLTIMLPVQPDGSVSTPVSVYVQLISPAIVTTFLLGLGLRHALGHWRWLGAPVPRPPPRVAPSPKVRVRRWRRWGFSLLGTATLAVLFRFVLLEPLARSQRSSVTYSEGLRGNLEYIESMTTLVFIQASLDGVAVLLTLVGLYALWRARRAPRI